MNLVFLDTETTSKENGRLVQLAFKTNQSGTPAVNMFFKPATLIDYEAMAVHHITNEQVENCPTFQDGANNNIQNLLDTHVMIAHNAKFDVDVLKREGVEPRQVICTLKVVRRLFDLSNYKLQFLRYRLGLEVGEVRAHDAEGDIEVLEALFYHLVLYMQRNDHEITQEEIIKRMIDWSLVPSLIKTINFGKHKGKTFADLAALERDYLKWLLQQPELDEDLIYSINFYLNEQKQRA
jgi:exodeoxyribonuclease X